MAADETREAIRRMMLASARIDGAYYIYARRRGIRENTLDLLYALDDGEPHTQAQLCADWLIPKTTINTGVRELRQAGLAEFQASPKGREKALRLTEAGRAFAREALAQMYAVERRAMEATLKRYPHAFVDAMEFFAGALCEGFEQARDAPQGAKE